jgi:hypothetical protein
MDYLYVLVVCITDKLIRFISLFDMNLSPSRLELNNTQITVVDQSLETESP